MTRHTISPQPYPWIVKIKQTTSKKAGWLAVK